MMFMIPIPPTRSDTAAMLPSSSVITGRRLLGGFSNFGEVVHAEIVLLVCPNAMALAKECRDLILGSAGGLRTHSGNGDSIDAGQRAPSIFFWTVVYGIIAVSSWSWPLGGLPLRGKNADDAIGQITNPNRLADGIAARK